MARPAVGHRVLLIGNGGHAAALREALTLSGVVVGHVEHHSDLREEMACSWAWLALGMGRRSSRKLAYDEAGAEGIDWATIIHPSATVSPSAQIGEGAQIMAGAIVQANAIIGKHAIINTGAQVDHGCKIGDFAHICPGAVLCADVTVEEGAMVQPGAVVPRGHHVGKTSRHAPRTFLTCSADQRPPGEGWVLVRETQIGAEWERVEPACAPSFRETILAAHNSGALNRYEEYL